MAKVQAATPVEGGYCTYYVGSDRYVYQIKAITEYYKSGRFKGQPKTIELDKYASDYFGRTILTHRVKTNKWVEKGHKDECKGLKWVIGENNPYFDPGF